MAPGSWPLGSLPSAWLGCPRFCPVHHCSRASHRGNDDHEVGRDVGDAGKEVRGQAGEVTLGELTGWEDLQHIGGLGE